MKSKLVMTTLVCAVSLGAIGAAGCGKKSDPGEDLGNALGNALVLGMAKDQYKTAKAKYDSGQDATADCILDTEELKKDKSAEAQQLAKDLDQLCEVDVPARALGKRLDDGVASVTSARTDKSQADMLPSEQLTLKMACDDTDERLKKIGTLGLSGTPNAKGLQTKRDADCTKDNLEGAPIKQAKRK